MCSSNEPILIEITLYLISKGSHFETEVWNRVVLSIHQINFTLRQRSLMIFQWNYENHRSFSTVGSATVLHVIKRQYFGVGPNGYLLFLSRPTGKMVWSRQAHRVCDLWRENIASNKTSHHASARFASWHV